MFRIITELTGLISLQCKPLCLANIFLIRMTIRTIVTIITTSTVITSITILIINSTFVAIAISLVILTTFHGLQAFTSVTNEARPERDRKLPMLPATPTLSDSNYTRLTGRYVCNTSRAARFPCKPQA